MKSNIISPLLFLFACISGFHATSFAQASYCNVPKENVQTVLNSRDSESDKYRDYVTTGIAYLLASECVAALSYFQEAQKISSNSAINLIVTKMNGIEPEKKPELQNDPPPVQTTTSVSEEELKKDGSIGVREAANTSSETVAIKIAESGEKEFSQTELNEFQIKGLQKVKKLTEYFNLISQKRTSESQISLLIESAQDLFNGDEHTVQVSSINRMEKPKIPIRTYLNRLRMLNYEKVEITGAAFSYVSKFRQGPDGKYYGIARFRQQFTGYRDGIPVYSDITTKTVAIVLKTYKKAIDGESIEQWDVFLGDISVQQTERN